MAPDTQTVTEQPAAQKSSDTLSGDLVAAKVATKDETAVLESREGSLKDEDAVEPVNNTEDTLFGSPSLTSEACDNVMVTPELLEAIISFLPIRNIFSNAQRVSRTWNAVVSSPTIQKTLWLRSPTEEVASPVEYRHILSWGRQPTFHLPSYMPMYSGSIAHNPTRLPYASGYQSGTVESLAAGAIYHRTSLAIPRRSSDTTRPTWLDMQLTEPRIQIAQLHVQHPTWGLRNKFNGAWASVQDADGLTFETVLAIAQKVCNGFPVDALDREQACVVIWFLTEH